MKTVIERSLKRVVLLTFFLAVALEGFAQLEVKAGLTVYRVRRGSSVIGLGYNLPLDKKISIRPELLMGIRNSSTSWDVPLMFNYQFSPLIGIHAGPHFSSRCSCSYEDREEGNFFSVGMTSTFKEKFTLTGRLTDGEILQFTAGYLFRFKKKAE